jgi:hypothetical protein
MNNAEMSQVKPRCAKCILIKKFPGKVTVVEMYVNESEVIVNYSADINTQYLFPASMYG